MKKNDEVVKIDRGVPIPPRRQEKYPIREMVGGDSILVKETREKVSGMLSYWRAKGRKFATRSMEGGVRIWRIL
ncbi:MAG: hypothetical protein WC637_00120 [Victivallales bacterium]